jgi:phage shock protein E
VVRKLIAPVLMLCTVLAQAEEIPNPLIDYAAFQANVQRVGELRESHRVTELMFIAMAADPATVILDARSARMFALLHVKGAKNLSLPDITEKELAKVIPSKATRILIYCNNNFLNEPGAFPAKDLSASLNVYTMNVLHSYGYTNVYELGPLIDVRETLIPFERASPMAAVTKRSGR